MSSLFSDVSCLSFSVHVRFCQQARLYPVIFVFNFAFLPSPNPTHSHPHYPNRFETGQTKRSKAKEGATQKLLQTDPVSVPQNYCVCPSAHCDVLFLLALHACMHATLSSVYFIFSVCLSDTFSFCAATLPPFLSPFLPPYIPLTLVSR